MKNLIQWILLCIITTFAHAQKDTLGWERNSAYNSMYSPLTVVEIEGNITEVEYMSPIKGMSPGVHLTVNASGTEIAVHLGPKWYFDDQKFPVRKGDKVEIKGSQVMLEGRNTIIANEIEINNKKLKLRDKSGIPKWSGSRRAK